MVTYLLYAACVHPLLLTGALKAAEVSSSGDKGDTLDETETR